MDKELLDYVKQQDVQCGLGWYGLIVPILAGVKYINDNTPEAQCKIARFEEKMGELEIAVLAGYPGLKDKITRAKISSKTICEQCGCVGELRKRDDGSFKTLCPECGKHYKRTRRTIPAHDVLDYMEQQLTVHCDGYGWHGLVMPVVAEAMVHNEKCPDDPCKPVFEEQEGKLHIGPDAHPACLETIITRAENASDKMCGWCGCRGKPQQRNNEGQKTLCLACGKRERNNERWEKQKKRMGVYLMELVGCIII